MKFTIKKSLLWDALSKVSRAIATKNQTPILGGMKFDLKKKKLVLTASDNDITIQTVIDSVSDDEFNIQNEGGIIIPCKYMLEFIRQVEDEYINFEVVDDLKVLIYTKKSKLNLNGYSLMEYPNKSLEESKKKIDIKVSSLKSIINQTAFATSNEESKPVLTGINFNIAGDVLECNATDSYRLARKIVKLDKGSEENYNIVVPSHNLLELYKILGEDDDIVELHIFNNKILFKLGNLKFESTLINGTYPNTSNLLPTDSFLIIHTNINDFYNVIARASIVTSDKEKNIVTLETNGNTLLLKSSSVEAGSGEETMDIEKNNDENIRISFSAKYMMDALKSFSTETVDLNFIGEIKPILLKSSEDESLTQLVLPVRTD